MKSERLKELVSKSGKSQKEIAEKLNLTQQRFNFYVNGVREPDNKTLCMIANYFNVTTDYLLGRDDDIETIAAHHDNDEWTDEELVDIEKFKEFIRMKKKNKRH